jgi:hemerythrin superfamily protein
MAEEITKLDSPIDVMYLIHKGMRADSARGEKAAAGAMEGGDLKAFKEALGLWAKQLLHHATAEDKYMTAPLTNSQPARDNEAEHAELARQATALGEYMAKGDAAGLAGDIRATMAVLQEKQHEELTGRLKAVEEELKRGLGESKVVARTRRHLYQQVVALRITENDHLENEEAFVLPVVRQRMNERQQLGMVRRLLIEDEARDPRWIISWLSGELTSKERRLLRDLEARLKEVPARTG